MLGIVLGPEDIGTERNRTDILMFGNIYTLKSHIYIYITRTHIHIYIHINKHIYSDGDRNINKIKQSTE